MSSEGGYEFVERD